MPEENTRSWQSLWRESSLLDLEMTCTPDPPDLEESVAWLLEATPESEFGLGLPGGERTDSQYSLGSSPPPCWGALSLYTGFEEHDYGRSAPEKGPVRRRDLQEAVYSDVRRSLLRMDAAEVLLFGLSAHRRRMEERKKKVSQAMAEASEEDLRNFTVTEDGVLLRWTGGGGTAGPAHRAADMTVPPFVTAIPVNCFTMRGFSFDFLLQLQLPSVWYIGEGALSRAGSIWRLRMDSVEVIEGAAFERTTVRSVSLTDSLVSIPADVLKDTGLEELILCGSRPEVFCGWLRRSKLAALAEAPDSYFTITLRGCEYDDVPGNMRNAVVMSGCNRIVRAAAAAERAGSLEVLMHDPASALPEEDRPLFREFARRHWRKIWNSGEEGGWILRIFLLREHIVDEASFDKLFEGLQKEVTEGRPGWPRKSRKMIGDRERLESLQMLMVEMLDYRNTALSEEKLAAAAESRERQAIRDATRETPTANELRHIWRTERNSDIDPSRKAYSITVTKYMGIRRPGTTFLFREDQPEQIEIPARIGNGTVTRIGADIFRFRGVSRLNGRHCFSRIRRADLPGGLLELEEYAFAGFQQTYFELPAGLRKIGAGAFSGCRNMKYLAVPEGVEEMERSAFSACGNLELVVILGRDTRIGMEEEFVLSSPSLAVAGWPGSDAQRMAGTLHVPFLRLGGEFEGSAEKAGMVTWLQENGFAVPPALMEKQQTGSPPEDRRQR